ncbi:MAG: hypothetical protein ACYSWU_09805 [Planctomycetota bacterium]|jgi:hypothetical protein
MLRKFSALLLPCAVLALLVAGALAVTPSTDTATVEQPPPLVERTFIAQVVGPDKPDWQAEDSLLLVVHKGPAGGADAMTFDAEYDHGLFGDAIDIAGKEFLIRGGEADVTHVTKGGPAPSLPYFWEYNGGQVDLPPPGARCVAGPNGNVVKYGWGYARNFMDNWRVSKDPAGATRVLCFGVGRFTK